MGRKPATAATQKRGENRTNPDLILSGRNLKRKQGFLQQSHQNEVADFAGGKETSTYTHGDCSTGRNPATLLYLGAQINRQPYR